jgi:hypothetical protein
MVQQADTLPKVTMPTGPVTDPADWRGPEVKDRTDWVYRLDKEDVADLEAAERNVTKKGLELISVAKDDFPLGHFGEKLKAIKRQLIDGLGFVLLRGLPLERYSLKQAATIYWGVNLHLGKPIPATPQGHLISHVIDRGETLANPAQGGTYTNETLRYHVDESDYVALLCLHPAKSGGASTLASAVAIHNAIQAERPDLLKLLYEPWYIDRRGYTPPEGAKPWYLMPVFVWHAGRLLTWVQPQFTTSSQRFPEVPRYTDKQWEAFELIQKLANDPRFRLGMTFGKGDIQVLNNHVILHSRTAYEDHPEPERKRHLLRIMTVAPEARKISPWHTAPTARTPGSRFEVYLGRAKPSISVELS